MFSEYFDSTLSNLPVKHLYQYDKNYSSVISYEYSANGKRVGKFIIQNIKTKKDRITVKQDSSFAGNKKEFIKYVFKSKRKITGIYKFQDTLVSTFVEKYNRKERIHQRNVKDHKGNLTGREKYYYLNDTLVERIEEKGPKGNKTIYFEYKDGKVYIKKELNHTNGERIFKIYNGYGNLVESRTENKNTKVLIQLNNEYLYDNHGNWIQRKTTQKDGFTSETVFTRRTISYYE